MSSEIVDQIYEAAFAPDEWPDLLEEIGVQSGSVSGAVLSINEISPPVWRSTNIVREALQKFVASGQWRNCERPMQLLAMDYPGFVCDEDYLSPQQIEQDPARKARLALNLGSQLATLISMPSGEIVGFTFERLADRGRHESKHIAYLDELRPHLARAGLLAARLGLERAKTAVATLEAIGLPAAVLTASGRVLTANALLQSSEFFLPAALGQLKLADSGGDALFRRRLVATSGEDSARSVPIRATDHRPAAILHILPVRGVAHDVFSGAANIVVLTAINMSANSPDAGFLRTLFDLTPAEAKIAAALSSGASLKDAAAKQHIQLSTARSYLETIFRKTGVHQQSQLVALLTSVRRL